MRLLALLLVLPQLALAQHYAPRVEGVRSSATVKFVEADKIGETGILQFYAIDAKETVYSFTIPDENNVLKGGQVLVGPKQWCVVVVGKSVVGISHVGTCRESEIGNPGQNFIGTVEINKALQSK